EAGAHTVLISGPVNLPVPERVHFVQVESALDMHAAVMAHLEQTAVFIASAAVADYRPAQVESGKIKKSTKGLKLDFVENPDIVAEVAAQENTYVVGFAAETDNLLEHAREKLRRKKLNMIVANDVSRKEIGFNSDNNAVTVVHCDNGSSTDEPRVLEIAETSKTQLARDLIQLISRNLK